MHGSGNDWLKKRQMPGGKEGGGNDKIASVI